MKKVSITAYNMYPQTIFYTFSLKYFVFNGTFERLPFWKKLKGLCGNPPREFLLRVKIIEAIISGDGKVL